MIDYDDLRNKAEAARLRKKQYENRYISFHHESAEFLYSGPRMEYALAEYREAATPEVTLRLLEIITVAERRLTSISLFDEWGDLSGAIFEAGQGLDEIANLKKE